MPKNSVNAPKNPPEAVPEPAVNPGRLASRAVGAKILTATGFRGRHQETIDHSFERARSRGEKLIGKNDERRVDAYLERINRGVEKYGSRYEQRLWVATQDSLIIEADDIPESYWRAQEQILRDNGQGHELGDPEKEMLADDIKMHQRETLEAWTSYLSHEDCPYPIWFKVYAIDGVSKMGVFDKSTGVYKKRDKHTVAPYPHFNAAVLGKVYAAVSDFYSLDSDAELGVAEPAPQDAELAALVKSGNFNKLYSRLLISEKLIMPTPEKTEDVHGEWVEYRLGDEEQLASAADGTPWCIATPAVGRSYLSSGHYGQVERASGEESRARFYLFHLYDEDGRLADNACASVRLDLDGQVSEISGLKDGQALEDSLVPIVEEKVRALPGGEKFLRRFADKERLISIDRKMQSGEDISHADFRFIYELDRPIETLDTYNSRDPRIAEFKKTYDAVYAAERGYITPDTTVSDVEENLEKYLANDRELSSNLLTFVLKKKFEENPVATVSMLKNLSPRHVAAQYERIRSLETYETDNYIFLLPTDLWGRDKIPLPGDPEGRALAPSNLTAILRGSVEYDYSYETDGARTGKYKVYGEDWVGKEVRHFPWSKELFAAESGLLKPHGYEIPSEWSGIVDSVREGLASERGVDPDDISDQNVIDALRSRYHMGLDGYVWGGESVGVGGSGDFWSSAAYDSGSAYFLYFYAVGFLNPQSGDGRYYGYSVRCVAR